MFLGFSYRETDDAEVRPIVELVEDILSSHNLRSITGEVLEGQQLTDGVKKRIDESDALVALMTPREPMAAGGFRPSDWVAQEFVHARAIGKAAIAVVTPTVQLNGMHSGAERIDLDPTKPTLAIVKLSQTIGAWKRTLGQLVRVRILPQDVAARLRKQFQLNAGAVQIEYRLTSQHDGAELRVWQRALPVFQPGGQVFVFLPRVPPHALIELKLTIAQQSWSSVQTPQWLHIELDAV